MNRIIVETGGQIVQVAPERVSIVGATTGENLGAPIAYPPIAPGTGTNPGEETLASKFWQNDDGTLNMPIVIGGAILAFLLLKKL